VVVRNVKNGLTDTFPTLGRKNKNKKMANLIEIPFNDGVTETQLLFNMDNIFDIEYTWDAVTGAKFQCGLSKLGVYDSKVENIKDIILYFNGTGITENDITSADSQSLKEAIISNLKSPSRIGSWRPISYHLDPVKYSVTSYQSSSSATTDF